MPRNISFDMGFPPFRGAVRQIILASVAIYVVILLLVSFAPSTGQALLTLGILDPARVRQGWIWQLVTYAFLHGSLMHIALNMFALYMFGASMERVFGPRRYLTYYFVCVLSAAIGV